MVDEAYADKEEWAKKSIRTSAKVNNSDLFLAKLIAQPLQMGKFSSDRAIMEYAESYWNLEPTPVPPGPAL